jgi:hypothetical protein
MRANVWPPAQVRRLQGIFLSAVQPQNQTKPSNLRAFGSAMWASWFTAMSGPLSVPAAIAALWVENSIARILLVLTAFACFWAAAYAVWKHERDRVLELEKEVSPIKIRQITAQEAHTEAIQKQTEELAVQRFENSPAAKIVRAKFEQSMTPPTLKLSAGTHIPYYEITDHSNLYILAKLFKIKLENIDPHKTAINCKVQILSISPDCKYSEPWTLGEGFTLAAGEHIYLPLASYREVREPEKFKYVDSCFEICAETEYRPMLGIEDQYVLTIRATANDAPFSQGKFKLWVDNSGKFQIERL